MNNDKQKQQQDVQNVLDEINEGEREADSLQKDFEDSVGKLREEIFDLREIVDKINEELERLEKQVSQELEKVILEEAEELDKK